MIFSFELDLILHLYQYNKQFMARWFERYEDLFTWNWFSSSNLYKSSFLSHYHVLNVIYHMFAFICDKYHLWDNFLQYVCNGVTMDPMYINPKNGNDWFWKYSKRIKISKLFKTSAILNARFYRCVTITIKQ